MCGAASRKGEHPRPCGPAHPVASKSPAIGSSRPAGARRLPCRKVGGRKGRTKTLLLRLRSSTELHGQEDPQLFPLSTSIGHWKAQEFIKGGYALLSTNYRMKISTVAFASSGLGFPSLEMRPCCADRSAAALHCAARRGLGRRCGGGPGWTGGDWAGDQRGGPPAASSPRPVSR